MGSEPRQDGRTPDRARHRVAGSWGVCLAALAVFIAVAVAYTPAMQGGFVWDDDSYVSENTTLRTFDGLRRIWFELGAVPQYYPLVHTTYWVEYHLWQLNPFGYHVVNVFLHGLGAVLLWAVLRRLSIPGAYLAAAIFALHPVHVESVAWITERKNVLSGVFYMSALLAYIRFARLDNNGRDTPHPWSFYVLSLVLYTCALFSKTVTCTLPAAILLVIWWKRGHLAWRNVFPLIPMFLIGVVMGIVTVWMETHHVGTRYIEWHLSLVDRCLVAGRVVWFYAAKLFFPYKLTFIYPRWHIDCGLWWQYLYPFAAISLVSSLWLLRRRVGRSPLFAVLFFCGTLGPALGFVNVYPMQFSYVADHFQYLASIGLITFCAALLTSAPAALSGRLGGGRRIAWMGTVLVTSRFIVPAIILCVLGTLTWRQGYVYKDLETLWRRTLADNPSAWLARYNLANMLSKRGEQGEAVLHYREAISIQPEFYQAHHNLGVALMNRGLVDDAVAQYREALRIKPDHASAHNSLGVVLLSRGEIKEAVERFTLALRNRPDYSEAHLNLGIAMKRQGDLRRAAGHYGRALSLQPDSSQAHAGLGELLARQGRLDDAVAHIRQAVRLEPQSAQLHNDLAVLLGKQGRIDEAIEHYENSLSINPTVSIRLNMASALKARGRLEEAAAQLIDVLRSQPDLVEARTALADILSTQGKIDEAVSQYNEALRLRPQAARLHNDLATVLGRHGRFDEAIAHLEEALQIDPDYAMAHSNLGLALAGQGKLDQAVRAFRAALRIDPKHVGTLTDLANTLRRLGDLGGVVQVYSEIVRLNPDSPDAHCNLGDALAQQGKVDEAIGEYRVALRIDERHVRARQAMSVLLDDPESP